ncbi:MAG: hypothetical protein ACP5MX_00825 [Candidatus Micrarchaeia archaeon]
MRSLIRAQSTMKYLMTYGWAILLAIVLAAMFYLGISNSSSSTGTACIAASGFLCSNPLLYGSTLTLTLGQATGVNWNTVTFCIVPSGASAPTSAGCPTAYPQNTIQNFVNGQKRTFNFYSTNEYPYPSEGNTFTGTVWALYTLNGFSGYLVDQIATLTAKNLGPSTQMTTTTVYYAPITITNTQNVPTPAPFQQMLNIDSNAFSSNEASGLQNVEFTTQPNAQGTPLQAWIESNPSNTATQTTYWVNLPNGIPADSNVIIYMNFMPNNVMSSSGPTGEAPELSSPYGAYDNGAKVFTAYINFASSSVPSDFTMLNDGTSYSMGASSNGIYVSSPGSGDGMFVYYNIKGNYNVEDMLLHNYSGSSWYHVALEFTTNAPISGGLASGSNGYGGGHQFDGATNYRDPDIYYYSDGSYNDYDGSEPIGAPASNLFTFKWLQGYQNASDGYGLQQYLQSSTVVSYNSVYGGVHMFAGPFTAGLYWFRIRAYPPYGIAPTYTVGQISSSSQATTTTTTVQSTSTTTSAPAAS